MPLFNDADFQNYSAPIREMINQSYRSELERVWDKFESYAHPHFKNEFLKDPGKFDSLTWEMLLGAHLLGHGYTLQNVASGDSPDICMLQNNSRIWIECVVPTRGDASNPDKVPEPSYGDCVAVDMDKNILRCIKALNDKSEQYTRWLNKKIINETDILLIAINGTNLQLDINETTSDIFRALYGIGDLCMSVDPENLDDVDFFYKRKNEISRKSGATHSTTFFQDQKHQHIDGVIFSNAWISSISNFPTYCFVKNNNKAEKLKNLHIVDGFKTYPGAP